MHTTQAAIPSDTTVGAAAAVVGQQTLRPFLVVAAAAPVLRPFLVLAATGLVLRLDGAPPGVPMAEHVRVEARDLAFLDVAMQTNEVVNVGA